MGFFDRSKHPDKPARRSSTDRDKDVGAREYEAKFHDRRAERFEAAGDAAAAQAERELAAELRQSPGRR